MRSYLWSGPVLAMVLCLERPPAYSAEEPPALSSAVRVAATALIAELGDGDFQKRTQAEEELIKLGLGALPVLEAEVDNKDLKIRTRVRRLVARFPQLLSDRLRNEFLKDVEESRDPDLPAWRRFRKAAGDDAETRAFFLDIARSYPATINELLAWNTHPHNLPQDNFGLHCNPFGFRMTHANRELRPLPSQAITIGGLWIYASSSPVESDDFERDHEFAERLAQYTTDGSKTLFDESQPAGRILRKLVRDWIARPGLPQSIDGKLRAAVRCDMLDDGVALAESLLTEWAATGVPDPSQWDHEWTRNIFGLFGHYGRPAHVRLLSRFLDVDTPVTSCLKYKNGVNVALVEVRDMALAAILELKQRNPEDFGMWRFELVSRSPAEIPLDRSCWHFPEESHRNRAFGKVVPIYSELGLDRAPRFVPKPDRTIEYTQSSGFHDGLREDPSHRVDVVSESGNMLLKSRSTGRPFGRLTVSLRSTNNQELQVSAQKWAFSPDGKFLAVAASVEAAGGTQSGNILVYHAGTSRLADRSLGLGSGPIRTLCFAEDGRTVLYYAGTQRIAIVPVKPKFRKGDPSDGK